MTALLVRLALFVLMSFVCGCFRRPRALRPLPPPTIIVEPRLLLEHHQ